MMVGYFSDLKKRELKLTNSRSMEKENAITTIRYWHLYIRVPYIAIMKNALWRRIMDQQIAH